MAHIHWRQLRAARLCVRSGTRRLALPLALASAYVVVRLWIGAGMIGHAVKVTDSFEYESAARESVFSGNFWAGYRPWGVPLFYKVLPGPLTTTVPLLQLSLSIACWLAFALVLGRMIGGLGGKLLVSVALAFSLVPAVTIWDGALLSESPSLSLGVLLLALLALLLRTPSWRLAALLLVAGLLWAGLRVTNGFLLLFLVIPAAALVWPRRRTVAAVLGAGACVIAVLTFLSANVRQWQVPLAGQIAGRALHDPDERAYFVSHGMPVRPGLEHLLWTSRVPLSRLEQTRALDWFLPWFNHSGRATLRGWLLSHPERSIGDPIRHLDLLAAPSSSTTDLQALPLSIYTSTGYRGGLPDAVSRVLYPTGAQPIFAATAAGLVLLVGLLTMGPPRMVFALPLIILLSTIPHAVIVWNGDATSLGRHALLLAVFLRLGTVIGLLVAITSPQVVSIFRFTAD
jgi:hypothetical protein